MAWMKEMRQERTSFSSVSLICSQSFNIYDRRGSDEAQDVVGMSRWLGEPTV